MADTFEPSEFPFVVYLPTSVTAPTGDISGAEWTDALSRLTSLEGMELAGLSDVDMTDLADGLLLAYDAGSDTWKPVDVQSGLTNVRASNGDVILANVKRLQIGTGLTGTPHGTLADVLILTPTWGVDENTVAMGNHTHSVPAQTRATFVSSGSLSSGTRTLVSGTFSGLDATRTYRLEAHLRGDLQGEGSGAGYTLPRIVLNAISTARFGQVRTVSGVPREYSMDHAGLVVTGLTSFTYSATLTYESGDPLSVGAGELIIRARASR